MTRPSGPSLVRPELDAALGARLTALCTEGWDLFERFDLEVRTREFHSFIAADYDVVLTSLLAHRGANLRFLEWGSATGVITIMADMLGYDASGIELDESLVTTARTLAVRHRSAAKFVAGSFLPSGYRYNPKGGDGRTATIGEGASGYLQLGHALDDFDVVFGYPWGGEEPMMLDLMRCYGRRDATLLLHGVNDGVKAYRDGRLVG